MLCWKDKSLHLGLVNKRVDGAVSMYAIWRACIRLVVTLKINCNTIFGYRIYSRFRYSIKYFDRETFHFVVKCLCQKISIVLHQQLRSGISEISHMLVWLYTTKWLKKMDTIGNCQRPVFSLRVSQHMHNITHLWKFELNWSSRLRENNKRQNTLVSRSCVLSDACFRDLKF